MKIKELTIYGFGKWVNKSFILTEDFVAFCGYNEAGKSTIQQFIHFVLFGFPKGMRKKDTNFYVPKDATKMGGKIVVSTELYPYLVIERIAKGKSSFVVTIYDDMGNQLPDTVLNDVLSNVSLDVYQQFFSITLNQLNQLKTISKDELNRYFLTLGTSGNDELFFWYDEWQKKANELYRPRSEKLPLNQALDLFYKQNEKYNELVKKQESYTLVQQQIDDTSKQLEEINQTLQSLLKEQNHFEKLKQLYPMYDEYTKIPNDKLESSLPLNIDQLYDTHRSKKDVLTKQLAIENDRLKQLNNVASEELIWFRQQSTLFKQALNQLPIVEKTLQDVATADFKMDYLKKDIDQALSIYQLTSYKQLPNYYAKTEQGEALLTKENELVHSQQQLNQDILHHEQNIAFWQDEKNNVINQKQAIQLTRTDMSKTKINIKWIILAVVNVLSVLGIFLSRLPITITVILILLLFGIDSGIWFYMTVKDKQKSKEQKNALQLKLSVIDNQVEQFEQKIATIQYQLSQISTQQKNIDSQLQHVQNEIAMYKRENNIPSELTLEQYYSQTMTQIYDDLNELYQLEQLKSTSLQKLHELMAYYSFFQEKQHIFGGDDLAVARHTVTTFKQFFDNMRVLDAQMIEKEQNVQLQQRDVLQIEEELKKLSQQEREWLLQANVQTIAQFDYILEQQKQHRHNTQRKTLLLEQLKDSLSYFEILGSYNQLLQQLEKVSDKYDDTTQRQQQLLSMLAKYQQEKLAIEQDGTVLDIQFELAQAQENIRTLVVELGSYISAMKMIEMMLTNGKAHVMDDLVNGASVLFAQLTDGNYNKVVFNDDKLRVIRHDKQIFELFELSQGTIDQFYIALRLAFIQLISHDINLPIIIDDSFVNFDTVRRQHMIDILKDMARTHQIIYMTYDTYIENQNIQVVHLNK